MNKENQQRLQHFRKSPLWFKGLNYLWEKGYGIGAKIRLDKDTLIREARKKTGLHDLGNDFADEPLDRLLWSIEHEAGLHPFGRFITRQRFVSLLSIRLRAEYFFKKYPAILDQELYPAWFIIGLQRTGTTKLQRLLAVDPAHRVIPSWEVINPVPIDLRLYEDLLARTNQDRRPGITYPFPGDKRIRMANLSVNAVKLISPGFFAVHPIDAMQPEEDILMLDVSFMSTTPEAMMPVESYASWLERTDQTLAYAYAAKLLKFLQWINPARRWILKSPHHLEFAGLIEKQFGKVHFLWPHRSLYESVPSYLSMLTYNHMMFCGDVDPMQVARHWIRKTGFMLGKALDYRLMDGNDSRFTDIWYQDLLSGSEAELEKIYRLNGGLPPELVQRFKAHEAEHPHRKYGTHHYSIGDFGMTNADIDVHTKHYQDFLTAHYGRITTNQVQ